MQRLADIIEREYTDAVGRTPEEFAGNIRAISLEVTAAVAQFQKDGPFLAKLLLKTPVPKCLAERIVLPAIAIDMNVRIAEKMRGRPFDPAEAGKIQPIPQRVR